MPQSTAAGGLALEGNVASYVLIPGAGGAGSYWGLVADELRRRSHEAVAVDLPAKDDAAGLPEYADAVLNAIGERSDVILVAQSMGGFTAPLVTERVSVRWSCWSTRWSQLRGEKPGEWWGNTGQPEARRRRDVEAGRRALEDTLGLASAVERRMLDGFSARERDRLLRDLNRCAESLGSALSG